MKKTLKSMAAFVMCFIAVASFVPVSTVEAAQNDPCPTCGSKEYYRYSFNEVWGNVLYKHTVTVDGKNRTCTVKDVGYREGRACKSCHQIYVVDYTVYNVHSISHL